MLKLYINKINCKLDSKYISVQSLLLFTALLLLATIIDVRMALLPPLFWAERLCLMRDCNV